MHNQQLQRALIVAAFFWHILAVFGDGWVLAEKSRNTRDFASYYYALEVARDGGNPYLVNATNGLEKIVRRNVHPYFYPPPALLAMTWIGEDMPVKQAYLYWFWLAEFALLAAAISLWRWFKPLSTMAGAVIVFALAVLSSIADNHLMGQVNTTVLMWTRSAKFGRGCRPALTCSNWLGPAELSERSTLMVPREIPRHLQTWRSDGSHTSVSQ